MQSSCSDSNALSVNTWITFNPTLVYQPHINIKVEGAPSDSVVGKI
jgi:hypothetical protein